MELKEAKEAEAEKITGAIEDKKARSELKLALEECRALILENSLDLKVQLINPAIEAERVNEQEARFEALFSVDAEYRESEKAIENFWDIIYGNKKNTININPGIEIPLRSGGTIRSNVTDIRDESNALPIFVKNNPSYSSDLSLSINHPLLRNAGKRAATYSIQLFDYNRQIVSAQTKQAAANIIAQADQVYWNLYAARMLLDVRRQEHDLAKDLFEETERLVEIGMKSEIELLRTRTGVSSSLERTIKAENTVRNMERNLKRMLNKPGLGVKTDTALILSTDPDPVHYEFDREQMVKNAIENRMDMLEMELRLDWDNSAIEYSRNQLHPILNLYYAYNISGTGGKRDDSYDMLFENKYVDHTVNLYASVPLGNRAAKSSLNQAIYTRARRLSSIENKKAMIKNEVLKDIDQLEASWQKILASRQTALYSGRQYEAEKHQYELGMRTANDVLQAQKDLAEARVMEILALTQYQVDLINLAYSTGTLLGAARIDLDAVVPGE
ncbi:TolC family protein [Thermodesulfobacteriota bacterium]